jgi:hypothetical protein
MRSWLLTVLFALSFASHAATPPTLAALSATGKIVVGPDGRVTSHRMDGKLAPAVVELVDRNVALWRFEPILVDGVARAAETRMRLEIRAVAAKDGSYRLSIESASFGEPTANRNNRRPQYPPRAAAIGLGARVLMIAKLDAKGHVSDVHAYQTSLDHKARSEEQARLYRAMFERASAAAVRHWKFTPGELVGGQPILDSVMVPIVFAMGPRHRNESGWLGYTAGPVTPAPWVTAESLARVDAGSLEDGETAALGSRFKLINPKF